MRIYRLSPTDDARLYETDPAWQVGRVRQLGLGRPWSSDWAPLPVHALKKPGRRQREIEADYSAIGGYVATPVLSLRMQAMLTPMLGALAQWLALDVQDGEPRVLLNLLNVVDALDVGASALRRLSDGRVMDIERYAFHRAALRNASLFKVPQAPFDVLGTEALRARLLAEGCTGLHFEAVWDDAAPAIANTP